MLGRAETSVIRGFRAYVERASGRLDDSPAEFNERGDVFVSASVLTLDSDDADDRQSAVFVHQHDALADPWSHCPTWRQVTCEISVVRLLASDDGDGPNRVLVYVHGVIPAPADVKAKLRVSDTPSKSVAGCIKVLEMRLAFEIRAAPL